MNEQYKLAVLLSTYNGEQYINQQLQSILNQTIKRHVTIIVRDDGSTDKTIDIIKKIQKDHNNIILLTGKNIGLVQSFFLLLNYGIKKKYDYLAFSDQDDYWLPDKLARAVNLLNKENSNLPLLYGSCSYLTDKFLQKSGETTQKKVRPIYIYNSAIQNILPGHTQVMNYKLGKILIENFDSSKNIYSQDLWITNVAAITGKVIFDNTPHVLYRMHTNNELGYGAGKIDRFKSHISRLNNKECKQISLQLKEIVNSFKDMLSYEEKTELNKFFQSQKNLFTRIKYVKHSKLYRQSREETIAFKILYVLGLYNI